MKFARIWITVMVLAWVASAAAEPSRDPVQEWLDRAQARYCDALMGGVGEGSYDKARGTCERTYWGAH